MKYLNIFKYTLKITDNQTVEMPAGCQAMCIQQQNGQPQLWVLCDPDAPLIPYQILCVGTGHEIKKPVGQYLGTIQVIQPISFVFHFFSSLDDGEAALPLLSGLNPAAFGVDA